MTSSRYTALVLSRAFLADRRSDAGEQLASFASAREEHRRVVPVVLRECELPLRIDFKVELDCTEQGRWEEEAKRLRNLLGIPEPAPERLDCPYPGMEPFGLGGSYPFCGRHKETQDLLGLLRLHPLLAAVGASGSGKSSLASQVSCRRCRKPASPS